MANPKLIAFNMYETWIDKGVSENPYKKLFATLGITKDIAAQLSWMLMTTPQAIEDILPKDIRKQEDSDKALETFYTDVGKQLQSLQIYPDFEDAIRFVKSEGYKTAVVSNLSKPYAYPLDHMIEPDTFDYKALSFELGVAKPDTKIFKQLQYVSGIDAKETVMIGDSFAADVKGALHTGIQPIHINRHKQGIVDHGRYIQISTLKDLETLFT